MALYLSWPAVSQICALMVLPSTCKCPSDQPPVLVRKELFNLNNSLQTTDALRSKPYLYASCRKLNADGRLGLQAELVASEPTQQVGLSNARVSNQHYFEEVIIAAK